MQEKITGMVRWFAAIWSDSEDEVTRNYRRSVRGLFVGWAITAAAMSMLELFPNEARLTMYDMLRSPGLPWQQHWLAALQLAGPLLMAWHLNGLRVWGKQRVTPQR